VGAGLLAKAVCQAMYRCRVYRFREQARDEASTGFTQLKPESGTPAH